MLLLNDPGLEGAIIDGLPVEDILVEDDVHDELVTDLGDLEMPIEGVSEEVDCSTKLCTSALLTIYCPLSAIM